MNKKIIENAAIACDNVAKAINGMQLGRPCNSCCPGRDAFNQYYKSINCRD